MSDYSRFLFSRPSFLEGVARLMDFGNHLNEYNYSLDGDQADYYAQKADWQALGNDMRQAVSAYEREALLTSDENNPTDRDKPNSKKDR